MKLYRRAVDVPGLLNFGEVDEGRLYRSAQPEDPQGYETAKKLGVQTIISFRQFHDEGPVVRKAGLVSISFPMTVLTPVPADAMTAFVLICSSAGGSYGGTIIRPPILCHCLQGQDRTGYFCATWRIIVDHWTYEEAEAEMLSYIPSQFGEMWWPIRNALKDVSKSQK